MQALVDDFLQYLRHERGQAEHTQQTYAGHAPVYNRANSIFNYPVVRGGVICTLPVNRTISASIIIYYFKPD